MSNGKNKSLVLSGINDLPVGLGKQYKAMLSNVLDKLPEVERDSENFYKSHSQFMQVTLDITALTPIRSIKHTLAEIDKTREALKSNFFSLKKEELNAKKKKRDADLCEDDIEREILMLEFQQSMSSIESSRMYIQGAVRKLNFLVNQHNNLLKKIKKDYITEDDYEREEARYHIMTCLKQALNAARSRGGVIDEGNLIYLFDLALPVAEVQAEIFAYLSWENDMMSAGTPPTHFDTVAWLERCSDKWLDCPSNFAKSRGFDVLDVTSLTNHAIEHSNEGDEE